MAVTKIRCEEMLCHIVFLQSILCLLITANVPILLILVTPMMEAMLSSKMSVFTRATWHNIPFFKSLEVYTSRIKSLM
jgi:hypothetical protein